MLTQSSREEFVLMSVVDSIVSRFMERKQGQLNSLFMIHTLVLTYKERLRFLLSILFGSLL
jgi:hypothetical protein